MMLHMKLLQPMMPKASYSRRSAPIGLRGMDFTLTRRFTKLNTDNESRAMKLLRMVLDVKTASRAAKVSVVVGSILVVVNQGDAIIQVHQPDWFKVVLTYLVPYCVSLWTSIVKDLEACAI